MRSRGPIHVGNLRADHLPFPMPPVHTLRQSWLDLTFLHWEVEPEQLHPFLPAGLELDLFEERAYVGIIPFVMSGVRPRWAILSPASPDSRNSTSVSMFDIRTDPVSCSSRSRPRVGSRAGSLHDSTVSRIDTAGVGQGRFGHACLVDESPGWHPWVCGMLQGRRGDPDSGAGKPRTFPLRAICPVHHASEQAPDRLHTSHSLGIPRW